jgi:hypothetical protein
MLVIVFQQIRFQLIFRLYYGVDFTTVLELLEPRSSGALFD